MVLNNDKRRFRGTIDLQESEEKSEDLRRTCEEVKVGRSKTIGNAIQNTISAQLIVLEDRSCWFCERA